ncbi:MAG: ATP-binding cassette domain-containing protein, partial [Clostridia bacterium]
HVRERLIGNLSKGYKQRVGLAQALIGDPDVLILDEPTGGLDPNQIIEIRNMIRDLGRERTIILSTHILPEVNAVCERVLVINEGEIVADGSASQLTERMSPEKHYTAQISGQKDAVIRTIMTVSGIKNAVMQKKIDDDSCEYAITGDAGVDVRKPLFFALAENKMAMLGFGEVTASLEDVFGALTGDSGEKMMFNNAKTEKEGEADESDL